MTKQQRKKINKEFYRYWQNRDKAASDIASVAFAHFGIDYTSERVLASHINTVENKTIRFIDETDACYRWCLTFEKTIERFRWTGKDKLMRMKYIERKKAFQIFQELGIERSTYFYWLNEILNTAFMWAMDLKII